MLFLADETNILSMALTYSGLVDVEQGWCCGQEQEEVINFNMAFYGQRSIKV
jgi:hypothetical protein